jgi:hypothetical protein
MTKAELLKMIEDEVEKTLIEPIREPEIRPVFSVPKPALKTEDEVDEYLFRAGNKKELREIFGLSKKEKEEKYLKDMIERAKKEVDNYNFNRLFKETDTKNSDVLRRLVDIALNDAKMSLQTLNLLMPQLFTRKGSDTGAMSATLNYSQAKHGQLYGIVPANFWFLIGGGNTMLDKEKSKERVKFEIDDFFKHHTFDMYRQVSYNNNNN